MVYVFLANGFEEIEALTPVDLLRRAGVSVKTVGVGDNFITGSHNITVACDLSTTGFEMTDDVEAIVLPGGMPGTLNLETSKYVRNAIAFAKTNDKYICAICAAPSILGHMGLLYDKEAICFPGYEDELEGAIISEKSVVTDGKFITAKGMGVSVEFGLEIIAALKGSEKAEQIKGKIQSV